MDITVETLTELATPALHNVASNVAVEFFLEARELARLSSGTHIYDDPYLIVQLTDGNQGYAFAHPNEIELSAVAEMVGRPVREIILDKLPNYLRVALLDAIAPTIFPVPPPPTTVLHLSGTARIKSAVRAQNIVRLLDPTSTTKVGVIGAIEDIVLSILQSNGSIRIADLHLKGQEICGIRVEADFLDVLSWCDAVLVTGNTLKTDTLSQVCSYIRARRLHSVAYCMTGHNIFPAIAEDLPFRWITAETFPFYWFAGSSSSVKIYDRKPA